MNDEDFKALPTVKPKPSLRYSELARIHHERQSAIISTLLVECPDPIPEHCRKLIDNAPESFDDLRYGHVANAIKYLRHARKPVSILTVQEEIARTPAPVDLTEIFKFLALQPQPLSPTMLEWECEELWNAYNFRRQATLFNEASASIVANPDRAVAISEHVRRCIDDLTRNGHSLPDIVCSHLLMEDKTPLPDLLIEGLLHRGSKMSLGGGSKSFKSWTFLSMGLAIATGNPWLGLNTIKSRVLIVNFEIADVWMKHRLEQVVQAAGYAPAPGWLDFWNLRGYSAPHAVIIPKIIERAKNRGYGLVIIDPSYKLIGQGDENSASDVGAMMGSFEKITTQTGTPTQAGAAVSFGAHFAKGNSSQKEAIDRISGSGVFARDPDTILTFTAHQQPNCFTVEATLRNLPQLDPFVVEFCFPAFQRKADLDPCDLKKSAGRPSTHSEDKLADLLGEESMSTKDWQRVAFEDLGVSRTTFFRLKEALEKSGKIMLSKVNGKWVQVVR